MKVSNYIMQLKEATGFSWSQISAGCNVPISTVRSIASGTVAQPNHQTLHDIITFLGGSLDDLYATPASVRGDMLEVRKIEAEADEDLKITIRTMRDIREEMLQAQREGYERQLAYTEDAYSREISHIKETHQREIASYQKSNRALRITAFAAIAALLLVLIIVIGVLAYDVTHTDNMAQLFYGIANDFSSTIGGI